MIKYWIFTPKIRNKTRMLALSCFIQIVLETLARTKGQEN